MCGKINCSHKIYWETKDSILGGKISSFEENETMHINLLGCNTVYWEKKSIHITILGGKIKFTHNFYYDARYSIHLNFT